MNASLYFGPYSGSDSAGWRDWTCWVPGRVHEDLVHQTLAPAVPAPIEETVPAPVTLSGADEAAQPVRI